MYIIQSFIYDIIIKYRFKFYSILLAIFIASLCTVSESYMLKLLINKAAAYYSTSNHFNFSDFALASAALLLLNIGNNLSWRITDYLSLKVFPAIKAKIYSETFVYTLFHSYSYFQEHLVGDLVDKINNIGDSLENIFEPLKNIFYLLFMVLTAVIMLISVSYYFSLCFLIWSILFVYISYKLTDDVIRLSGSLAKKKNFLNGKYADSIRNILNVIAFDRRLYEKKYIDLIFLDYNSTEIEQRWKLLKMLIIQGVSCTFILGIMLLISIKLYIKEKIVIGDFVFVMSITMVVVYQIFGIATLFSKILVQVSSYKQASQEIFSYHKITEEKKSSKTSIIQNPSISFKQVKFSYGPRNPVFKGLTINILPNQKIGLVGYSGSGKSTFINLLLRLYDICDGEVKIGEHNIRNIALSSLYENITFISQVPQIFNRSFMENIRYGKMEATDREVIAAAKKAKAHEFIIKSYNGYNTILEENGANISGGERQRIGIARAILKDSPILIIDEATSSLDVVTESAINKAFEEVMKNKTVITIAHRISTVLKMDRIIVLDRGKIVGDGDHEYLIKHNKFYIKLWQTQTERLLNDEESENSI